MANGNAPKYPKAPEDLLAQCPEGWGLMLASSWDEDREGWYYQAATTEPDPEDPKKAHRVIVAEVEGPVWVPYPETNEAADTALAETSYKIVNGTGKEKVLKGASASATKLTKGRHETTRGMLRTGKLASFEAVQQDAFDRTLGRDIKAPEVSDEALNAAMDEGGLDAVKALLRRARVKLT